METLVLKGVTKSYIAGNALFERAEATRAIARVDMVLEPGRIYGLVGESGSGKSTLGRILTGLEKPDTGSIQIGEKDLHGKKKAAPFRQKGFFQMVFQNPFNSLNPRLTIRDILLEPCKNQPWKKKESLQKIENLMQKSELPLEYLLKFPNQLSGGERQRVAIIRALLSDPKILILDEPTSSLDVSVRKQILDLIRNLLKGRELITLLISHDLSVIAYLAEYLFVMREGFIVEQGEVSKVYKAPQDAYTKQLLWAAYYMEGGGPSKPSDTGECCP